MRRSIAFSAIMLSACTSASNAPDTTAASEPVRTTAAPMNDSDPDKMVANGGISVPGWTARLDPRAVTQGRTLADVKLYTMGSGQHITGGPAAIYWNPASTRSGGNYTASASFTQMKPATHAEGYGLFIGGQNLNAANQSYVYFLVRQDGKFLINHRASDTEVHKLRDWTANPAIRMLDASGKSTNALSIALAADAVSFRVNGTEVHSLPRNSVGTSGVVGLRVNHNLDVHVDGFTVTR